MEIITIEYLKEIGACLESQAYFIEKNKKQDALVWLHDLIADNQLDWANCFICKVFIREQQIKYAIFAAEQVIGIFEEKYPDDKRPRQAIEAARLCLDHDKSSAEASAEAGASARFAVNAATNAAAASAASAASTAAGANNSAMRTALYAAAAAMNAATSYGANAASMNAATSDGVFDVRVTRAESAKMLKKILEYGFSLLEKA